MRRLPRRLGALLCFAKLRPGSSYAMTMATTALRQIGANSSPRRIRPTVVLTKSKAGLFRAVGGEQLVFSGAVERVEREEAAFPGCLVDVVDGGGKVLGFGAYNAASMFRVRILWHASDGVLPGEDDGGGGSGEEASCEEDPRLVAAMRVRIRSAVAKRRRLGLLPSDSSAAGAGATTAYRLVNGEGDRLSGLVVDVLGGAVVIQSGSAWCEVHRASVEAAVRAEVCGVASGAGSGGGGRVVWERAHARLKQDGWTDKASAVVTKKAGGQEIGQEGYEEEADGCEEGRREVEEEVVIEESGLKYAVALGAGQKTGFYCDQRENRALVRSLVRPNDSVLDLCCYSGGFSLSAAAGGAARVVGVDSSAAAVALAARNAALNGFHAVGGVASGGRGSNGEGDGEGTIAGAGPVGMTPRVSFVQADISAFMAGARARGEAFDVVVLDPPKLAPSRRDLPRATVKYQKLNRAALEIVKPGGLLVTCSCSSAMTLSGAFWETVAAAARDAGRRVTLLRKEGAAPDHVVSPSCKEGEYLTALFCFVE